MPDGESERKHAERIGEDGQVAGVDAPAAVKGESRSEKHDEAANGIHDVRRRAARLDAMESAV